MSATTVERTSLTVKEAAERLGVPESSLVKAIKKNAALPAFWLGGHWNIRVRDLDQFIDHLTEARHTRTARLHSVRAHNGRFISKGL